MPIRKDQSKWLTRKELNETQKATRDSAEALKEQSNSIKIQNFDQTANTGLRIDNITFKAATAIKNVTIDNSVYATNGTVYAEGEFQIFSVSGQNVTELNGQLNGIYVVKTVKGIQKVAVK